MRAHFVEHLLSLIFYSEFISYGHQPLNNSNSKNRLLTIIKKDKQSYQDFFFSQKQNIFTMNSVEKDSENTKNFDESLNATLEEKQKLENMLSSMKAESSTLRSNIESVSCSDTHYADQQNQKLIGDEILSHFEYRNSIDYRAQEELLALCADKQKIEDLINAELETSLNDRIQQLEECIKYSENHWIFRYFNNINSEVDTGKQETEDDEILQIENEEI
ncbi:hypothetical protein KSF78_0001596 [Schistosoma japonicum]|nr:hypothetical protein KSF78_0001596 [Schistosoma japonicum]